VPTGASRAPAAGQSAPSGRQPTSPDLFLGPTLEVVKGEASASRLHLGQALLRIGRTTHNDLVVKDAAVSRSHAQILFEGDRFLIEDLGSANGTYVNGNRIERVPLANGSRIVVGQTEMLYTYAEPEVPAEVRLQLIGRCEVLAGLDHDTRAALAGDLALRYFPQQATVLQPDAPVESIFFVVSGTVRMVEVNDEGGQSLLREVGAGEYFGEQALLPGPAARWTAIAETTLSATARDGSPRGKASQSANFIGLNCKCRSMRSMMGPETFARYLCTCSGVHEHSRTSCPR
jgi:hypothetical protein